MTEVWVHERFQKHAAATPDAVAVVFEGESLTYEELDHRTSQLAQALHNMGLGRAALVGLALPRSADLVVGAVGILQAGYAYLPLDPSYPRHRLEFMVSDSQVDVIVSHSSLAEEFGNLGAKLILMDELPDLQIRTWTGPTLAGDDLAYVMYTSGSTGKPKGVQVTHRNVARLFDSTHRWFDFSSADTWTLFHSYSFDFSVWELWGALSHGGTLVVVPHNISRSPRLFRELVAQQGVTVLNQTPSAFLQFIEADLQHQRGADLALRYVIFGGEALDFAALRPWFEAHGDASPQLINMYGITETTVHVTYRPVDFADVERGGPSLIGVAIPDLELHILDDDLTRVPVGVPGELYVGGAGVSSGYLNREALTRERFIKNPFGSSGTMYRTGDLVRARHDGDLEYLGRADDQIQLRGFRVELGEITSALLAHKAVRQALIISDRIGTPGQRLVAYVSTSAPGDDIEAELRNFLIGRLPEYMLPAVYVFVDAFALTENGKIDRDALPNPGTARPRLSEPYAPPHTSLERHLARLWQEILQIDEIGSNDRFFELGGSSLQAAQFVNRLQAELDEPIFVVTIFGAPTIASYARFLEDNYAAAIGRLIGSGATTSVSPAKAEDRTVDRSMLDEMQRYIPRLDPPPQQDGQAQLAPAIFVLAPPRSGTTLLRMMLAGHPHLFGAAELQLLGFHDLGSRREAFSGEFSLWREGAIRALMAIHDCGPERASQIMESAEEAGSTTKEFYGKLQAWIAPRTLVDKSPAYALDPNALAKAEYDFDGPVYIHLVRHPQAMVNSFTQNRVDQVLYLRPHPFSSRELAELVWTLSHEKVLAFLADIPDSRQHKIAFEDLVTQPEETMRALCESIGLAYDPNLLRPYEEVDQKMADGLYPESTPMGDPGFLDHGKIRPEVANHWRANGAEDLLGDPTWELAQRLGYERPGVQPGSPPLQRPSRSKRSDTLSRQRLLRTARRPDSQGKEES